MAYRRCSPCDLDLPNDKESCPVCAGEAWYVRDGLHDPNWRKRADSLLRRPKPGERIPNAQIEIVERDSRLFVAEANLEEGGYFNVAAGSIVQIRGEYYEIVGPMFKHSDTPSYWLEKVMVGELEVDHPVLSDWEYAKLERKRGLIA